MKFQTEIPIQKSDFPIDYQSKILLLGSCFAENIGKKFQYYKFQAEVNPFGIIFNPVSLEKLIRRTINKEYFSESDIFYHNNLWHCFAVHSKLSYPDKEEFLSQLNKIIDTTYIQISKVSHLIITVGTSWVYRLRQVQPDKCGIVANCHKVPQKEFTKELLSTSQIAESLQNIISLISSINPNCKFIFTVSPVRHIKDGFVENNVSKAHLLSAIFETVSSNRKLVNYFPSYELVLDELRDYRFYKNDMLHPNQIAIDYIWIRFIENYVNENEFGLMNEICSIQKALQHKPFNPGTEAHKAFQASIKKKIAKLTQEYSFIKF